MSDLFSSNPNYQLYSGYATQAANDYGVPSSLLLAQIGQESSWNPLATNGSATGLGQFEPNTWSEFGSGSPTDPYASIDATAAYDSYLYGQSGNWNTVLQQYGTTANVPSSVTTLFNGIVNSVTGTGNSTSATSATTGSTATTTASGCSGLDFACWFGLLAGRAGIVLLGLILVAGALYLFKGTQTINVSSKT